MVDFSGISRNRGTTRPMNIPGSMLASRKERVEDRKVGQCTRVATCEPADRWNEPRPRSSRPAFSTFALFPLFLYFVQLGRFSESRKFKRCTIYQIIKNITNL